MRKNLVFVLLFLIKSSFAQLGNWTNIGTPSVLQPYFTPNIGNYYLCEFISSSTGVVFGTGGPFALTTNGGTSWILKSSSISAFKQIQSLDQDIYVLGQTDGIELYKNLAQSRHYLFSNVVQGPESYNRFHFVSSSTGWVTRGQNTLLNTTNGGASWAVIDGSSFATGNLQSVFFIDEKVGWIAGNGGISNAQGSLFNTTNGGNSWIFKGNYGAIEAPTFNAAFSKVVFTSKTKGFAIGGSGNVFLTTNAGANWFEASTNTTQTLLDIDFGDDLNGFAVGTNGAVIQTTNGGLNWENIDLCITSDIMNVSFAGSDIAWIAGRNNLLMKYTKNEYDTYHTKLVTQPTGFNLCQGLSNNLTVSATGTNLNYLWSNGQNSGPTISISQGGIYNVSIPGICGTIVSNFATVTVQPSTQIIRQPVSQSTCSGRSALFEVSATGVNLSYIWNISNVQTRTILGTSFGSYIVTVSGLCGNVISNSATLTQLPSTLTQIQPQSGGFCQGGFSTLTIMGTGAAPIAYKWNTGSTGTSLNVNLPGVYFATISGLCGNAVFQAATITQFTPPQFLNNADCNYAQFCKGNLVNINIPATGSGLNYLWSNGSTSQVLQTNIPGCYTLTITGTCGKIISKPFSAIALPVLTIPSNFATVAGFSTVSGLCYVFGNSTTPILLDAPQTNRVQNTSLVSISPNPSLGEAYIEVSDMLSGVNKIEIYNSSGLFVKYLELNTDRVISTGKLTSGSYIAKVGDLYSKFIILE